MIKTTLGLLCSTSALISMILAMYMTKDISEASVILLMLASVLLVMGVLLIVIDKVEVYEDE